MSKVNETVVDVNAVSRISEGTAVVGDITTSNDIRIDGRVNGKIYSEGRVVVGDHAVVEGTVVCSNLDLWGSVEGEIFVKDLLSLKGTAVVKGNLHIRKLQVEIGASLNGTCKMISEEDFDACAAKFVSKPSEVE